MTPYEARLKRYAASMARRRAIEAARKARGNWQRVGQQGSATNRREPIQGFHAPERLVLTVADTGRWARERDESD